MPEKKYRVKSCDDCPNRDCNSWGYYCTAAGKDLFGAGDEIPPWCPLKDYDVVAEKGKDRERKESVGKWAKGKRCFVCDCPYCHTLFSIGLGVFGGAKCPACGKTIIIVE